MNKKGLFGLGKLGDMILIAIVLIILLLGGAQLLWKAAKAPLKLVDNWFNLGLFSEEQDLTTLNELAQNNFDILIKEINDCKNTKKVNCKCLTSKGFNDFSTIHAIKVYDDKMQLLIIKDRNELLKDEKNIETPKCYTTKTSYSNLKNPSTIKFNDKVSLEDNNGKEIEFIKSSNLILAKNQNNQVCWLSNDRDSGTLEFCQT